MIAGQCDQALVKSRVGGTEAVGILVAGNVAGKDPEAVAIGDHVRVVFEEARDPRTGAVLRIPQWQVVVA